MEADIGIDEVTGPLALVVHGLAKNRAVAFSYRLSIRVDLFIRVRLFEC
jgi:hypothetical protein